MKVQVFLFVLTLTLSFGEGVASLGCSNGFE